MKNKTVLFVLLLIVVFSIQSCGKRETESRKEKEYKEQETTTSEKKLLPVSCKISNEDNTAYAIDVRYFVGSQKPDSVRIEAGKYDESHSNVDSVQIRHIDLSDPQKKYIWKKLVSAGSYPVNDDWAAIVINYETQDTFIKQISIDDVQALIIKLQKILENQKNMKNNK